MFSSLMFTGLMANTWIAASIVAVIAGVTGFFAVLRGETFAAHAIPNGAFAGAAGAALLGVNVRLTGVFFLMALAVTVSLSAIAIGAVLSTALLVGPAATALRITRSPVKAIAVSAAGGLAATWLSIWLAYESYYWPPYGHGWPVSFFVVALVLAGYLLSYARRPRRALPPRSPHEGAECSPA